MPADPFATRTASRARLRPRGRAPLANTWATNAGNVTCVNEHATENVVATPEYFQ